MNPSNFLSTFRLASGPVVFYFIIIGNNALAFGLFLAAAASDLLDGYFARKLGSTRFGRFLDPFADKVLYISTILGILISRRAYIWLAALIFISIVFVIGNDYIIKKGLKVNYVGKTCTFIEAFFIFAMLLGYVNNLILGIFVVLLLIPGLDYIRRIYITE